MKSIFELLNGKVFYKERDKAIWIKKPNGRMQMLVELRGANNIRDLCMFNGVLDRDLFLLRQNELGQFIAMCINNGIENHEPPRAQSLLV